MDTNNLIVWLPFDVDFTSDHCGGQWTAFGEPVIRDGKIYLDGNSSYVAKDSPIELGGNDFTICGQFIIGGGKWAEIFKLYNADKNAESIYFERDNNSQWVYVNVLGERVNPNIGYSSAIRHFEIDYVHADGTAKFFLNGVLRGTITKTVDRTTFENCRLGYSLLGTIDEFMIYDGVALHTENFTPPTDDDYFNLKLAEFGSVATSEVADMERVVCNKPDNVDRDACYKFTGAKNSYASIPIEVLGGATEFTIEIKFATTDTTSTSTAYLWGNLIGRDIPYTGAGEISLAVNDGKLCLWGSKSNESSYIVTSDAIVNDGQIHVAAVRSNADGSLDLFCDGELVLHVNDANALITKAYTLLISQNQDTGQATIAMDFYEARLWRVARDEIFADIDGSENGLEAWYLPTPTGIVDYSTHVRNAAVYNATYAVHVNQSADLERILINGAIAWRYEDRTVYIGTGNPITFHIPRVAELWAKFSVYFDGLNRWFASDSNGNGLAALKTLALDFTANNETAATFADICTPLRTQEILLHMRAGVDDGLIEAWADGDKIGEFTGNVNNARPFEEFALRSDDSGTSFTDLIVSNQSLLPTEKPSAPVAATQFTHLNLSVQTFEFTATDSAVAHVNLTQKIHTVTKIFKPINSLWMKFDVTSDGVNSWRAYSDGDAGQCGVAALLGVDFFANGSDVAIAPDICSGKQTFVLHMESDTSDGLIELYCDGQLVGSYSGNVNDGNEFTDVYLTSESEAAVFDNFIVSSERLTFDAAPVDVQSESEPPTLTLNIFHAGEVHSFPLSIEPSAPAITIRKFGVDWFAPLSENNSPVKISLGGQVLSLGR